MSITILVFILLFVFSALLGQSLAPHSPLLLKKRYYLNPAFSSMPMQVIPIRGDSYKQETKNKKDHDKHKEKENTQDLSLCVT